MKSASSPTPEFLKCQQAQHCAKGQAQCLLWDSRQTLLQTQSKLKSKLCVFNIDYHKVSISIFKRIEIESSKGYKQNWNTSGQTFKSNSSMFGTSGVQLDLLAPAHMAALLHRLYEFPCLFPWRHSTLLTYNFWVSPLLARFHSHSFMHHPQRICPQALQLCHKIPSLAGLPSESGGSLHGPTPLGFFMPTNPESCGQF